MAGDLPHPAFAAPGALPGLFADACRRLGGSDCIEEVVLFTQMATRRLDVFPVLDHAVNVMHGVTDNLETLAKEPVDSEADPRWAASEKRWDDACSVVSSLLDSIVVVAVEGPGRWVVYWNWCYVYSVRSAPPAAADVGFFEDLGDRWLHEPTVAVSGYASQLVDVAPELRELASGFAD